MTIHERIRQRREALGLSMEDLAKQVGTTWQTVQQWENGKTAPARKRLPVVADKLGVTPHWLLFGDVPNPENLTPEALLWAARFDSMNERERRKFAAAMLLAADGAPDEKAIKQLPPPAKANS